MRLSFEDIKKHTRGVCYIEDDGGVFVFHRFSKEVEAMYAEKAPDFLGRARATTGVVIDFITDSENISFKLFKLGDGESRYFFDVYEDDLLIYSSPMSNDRRTHALKLSTGNTRVRIYLCSHSGARFSELELDDGATILTPKYTARALMFGDSITQGARALHTSLSYANIVAAHFGWDATNYGVGSDIFREWLPGDEKICDPDIITVAYGTNDWGKRPLSETLQEADGFFARLRRLYPTARGFCVSPIWRSTCNTNKPGGDYMTFISAIEDTARAHGFTPIRGLNLVAHMECFFEDGLHPNELGYSLYARALIDALEKEGVK